MIRNIRIRCGIILAILLFFPKAYAYPQEIDTSSRKQFRIAIFSEKSFPSVGAPSRLTPEWLYEILSGKFSVEYLDSTKLADKKYLNPDKFDLLILPYGEAFPYAAFPQIKEFLMNGGGLFNLSGIPFWAPMTKLNGQWRRFAINDPYKEFLSPLGIKYYETPEQGSIGLTATTSLSYSLVKPTRGNVFPYRLPARSFDRDWPGIFIKSWKNAYNKTPNSALNKWCLLETKGESHSLNPQNQDAQKTLMRITDYLSFPIIVYALETDLAAYCQGESVGVSLKVMNSGKFPAACVLEFEILDQDGKVVYKSKKPLRLTPGEKSTLRQLWQPHKFQGSFYTIRAYLLKDGSLMDKEENGFVITDPGILKKGPSIKTENQDVMINGKKSLILGVNYYESRLGELLWVRPNLLRIRQDFRSMRNLGINFVRIHYHHSKWFRDYFSQVVKEGLDQYLEISDSTALPSERSLRILDALIQLAQEEGIIFCMDIFSLVPQEMGNPLGWLGLKERITEPDKIKVQKDFVRILARRYKDVPGISWDLWNEPRLEKNDTGLLRGWVKQITDTFRQNGDRHPITLGDDLSLSLIDDLDYACIHTYEPADFIGMKRLNKPVVFQETWNPAGCSLAQEARQAEELKKDFADFRKTAMAGFIPWQWTRQARLWDSASESERWDDELGLCVREDGSLKPAGQAYGKLIRDLFP